MVSWFVYTGTELYHKTLFSDNDEEIEEHIKEAWNLYNNAITGAWIYIYDDRTKETIKQNK